DTTNYENIDGIILCGGASLTAGFAALLGEKSGINIRVAEPFKNIHVPETFDSEYLGKIAPAMSVAVGLALRRVGDK
ncbi:MAG: pilus assembly protein PilM, partial [Nitrospiraceae bacterium]